MVKREETIHGKLHTVLSVATRNVPGIETPVPPPMVTPLRIATCMQSKSWYHSTHRGSVTSWLPFGCRVNDQKVKITYMWL